LIFPVDSFYDLFVGIGSLAAGAIANRFGYAAAFLMAAAAIGASAVSGRYVFRGHGAGSSPGFGRSRFSTDDVTHSR